MRRRCIRLSRANRASLAILVISVPIRFVHRDVHTLHAVIYPAEQIAQRWVAHCLELDIVTYGRSESDAIAMLADAIATVAEANVQSGQPPLQFRNAPRDVWRKVLPSSTARPAASRRRRRRR